MIRRKPQSVDKAERAAAGTCTRLQDNIASYRRENRMTLHTDIKMYNEDCSLRFRKRMQKLKGIRKMDGTLGPGRTEWNTQPSDVGLETPPTHACSDSAVRQSFVSSRYNH